MTSHVQIVNGPSKFDLMLALFEWKPNRPLVMFKTEGGKLLEASVTSVEAEDGSGESWNIEGYVGTERARKEHQATRFRAYFRTDSRRGVMKPENVAALV
ncbi:MAG TPA: hypothetical protein VM103_01465 [Candidatus Paceibacterota bacterium]|nr:hypothetical protein [Candidatus Paceibacterota bacterium]